MPESKKQVPDELYYLHIDNLPWSAGHKDVLTFFDGIAIPFGGISIYCKDAFIVVTTKEDSLRALALNGREIHGTSIHLMSSTKRDAFRQKCRYVSRKLQFSPPIKRIRPTVLPGNSKDTFSIFNPAEIYFSDANLEVLAQQPNRRKSKKIRPTLLKDLKQLQVFEKEADSGGQCVKKMKLADDWLVSHLEVV